MLGDRKPVPPPYTYCNRLYFVILTGSHFLHNNVFVKKDIHCYLNKFYEINSLYLYYQFSNNYNYNHLIQRKNVSSPEDIILSEHVDESLPRELCDIP
jgi:hypothetical protein